MAKFYDAYKSLYDALFAEGNFLVALAVQPDRAERIEVLRQILAHLQQVWHGLEIAYDEALTTGTDSDALYLQYRRAKLMRDMASDLLKRALDNSVQITGALAAFKKANDDLEKLAEDAADLADDLSKVSTVLDTVGRALKLIT